MKSMISQEQLVGVQTHVKRRKRSHRKKSRKVLLIICLLVCGIALPTIAYPLLSNRYHQDVALAYTGARQLEAGMTLLRTFPHDFFNTRPVSEAQQDFRGALTIFSRLNSDVNFIPDVLTLAPAFGSRLGAAKHLLPLALDAAQAGFSGCTIINTLISRLHSPLSKTSGLTMLDFTELNQNLQDISMVLAQAAEQVKQLQPGDLLLNPGLGKMLNEFHTYLPLIQPGVDQATAFFSVLPQVLGLGVPAHYLVEILDSTELRPAGGFIGNYGIVTLAGGQITSAQVTDTYNLDYSYKLTHPYVPFPSAYAWFPFSASWGLRDSNLSADFPTSARNAETLYNLEAQTSSLAGVIAITPQLIEQILTLTGPISVPEYHETVTAQNLIDRIHYHQLIEDAGSGNVPSTGDFSSDRKHFTALLGQYMFARVRTLPTSLLPKLFGILSQSLHTRDLQIYFTPSAAEKVLQFYHLDDSIQSPVGDGIFVVDANIAHSKANQYLLTTVNDQVTIDHAGTATHHTVIRFNWTKPGLTVHDFYGSTLYKGYLQIYVPSGSVLQTHDGWSPHNTGIAFGRTFWAGNFSLPYPLTGTITLTWRVAGVARKDGHNWLYPYLMLHQAGAQEKMYLQVALPPCATIAHTSTGVVKDTKQQAHLAQILNQDTEVTINYNCPK